MAKPKLPALWAEVSYTMPEPVEVLHPDGSRQTLGGPWATFYRMKCLVDGQEAAAEFILRVFGPAERIGMQPYEIGKEEYERFGVLPQRCPAMVASAAGSAENARSAGARA